ncbi:MAG: hypothetical protein DRP67_03100 [Candidatus Omnitrophota bacterium]|nr:MAG: hypothetical protein DRP67_03100 [Candidatus Omnitrophota bacterium]
MAKNMKLSHMEEMGKKVERGQMQIFQVRNFKNKGFTLIELTMVLLILAFFFHWRFRI